MDLNNIAQNIDSNNILSIINNIKVCWYKTKLFPFISLTIVDKGRFNGFLNNNNFYYYYHLFTIRQFIVLKLRPHTHQLTILSLYNMELTQVKRKR